MNSRVDVKRMTFVAVVAAMYVAMTVINPLGYGLIQFRISEIILLIPFWDRKYVTPCLLGVGLANLFSPLGFIDVICGILIGLIAYFIIGKVIKNHFLHALLYAIICGLIVGFELSLVYHSPFIINFTSVALSQLIIGVVCVFILNKFQRMKLIGGK